MKAVRFFVFSLLILLLFCSCTKSNESIDSTFEGFSESDLNSSTIGLYAGTPVHAEILEKYPNAKLEFLTSTSDMLLYLQQHKSDCFVIGSCEYKNITGNKTGLAYIDSSFDPVRYASIFSNERIDVMNQFNEFIKECLEDGTIIALEQEWIDGTTETKSIDCTYSGENGILKIATEASHAPMTFIQNNEVVGFEIDLICQFCEKYGYTPEIYNCGWDPMNMGIQTGKYDIGCSNIMYSDERSDECNFSDVYYTDPILICYINPDYIDLKTLSGKKISVVVGSIFDIPILNNKEIENPELLYYLKDIDSFNSVITGKTFAGVSDYPLVHYSQVQKEGIKIASNFLLDAHCAFAMKKDFALKDEINSLIRKYKEDGTIKRIQDKWYNADEHTTPLKQDWPGKNGTIICFTILGAPPVAYLGPNGEAYGYDVDILLHIARELDYKVEFTFSECSATISAIVSGKADLGIGGIAMTEERAQVVDFSEETNKTGVVLFTKDESIQANNGGFFTSIKENLIKTFVTENRWKMFMTGCLITLAISLMAVVCGTVLGFLMYMVCRKGNKIINKFADFYLWLINGIPVVVLLMVLFYIIFGNSTLNGVYISAIGFSMIFASGMLGMLRMGVSAIDKSQEEAGLALGYTSNQTFFKIILPQAARVFPPSYKNEIVQTVKATAVVGYIAVQDLTKASDLVRSRTFAPFFPLIVSGVLYFIMAWILTIGIKHIINRVAPSEDEKKRAEYLKGVVR